MILNIHLHVDITHVDTCGTHPDLTFYTIGLYSESHKVNSYLEFAMSLTVVCPIRQSRFLLNTATIKEKKNFWSLFECQSSQKRFSTIAKSTKKIQLCEKDDKV